jgi:hypothetical protein
VPGFELRHGAPLERSSCCPGVSQSVVRDAQIIRNLRIAGVTGMDCLKVFLGLGKQSSTQTASRPTPKNCRDISPAPAGRSRAAKFSVKFLLVTELINRPGFVLGRWHDVRRLRPHLNSAAASIVLAFRLVQQH